MGKATENRWQALGDMELQSTLQVRAREVADRLKDLERLQQHYVELEKLAAEKGSNYSSNGFDLAHGYAGLCLLIGELDRLFPDESWDLVGRDAILLMKQAMSEAPVIPLSMWSGLAGVGLAVRALSREGSRYQGFLAQLDELVIQHLPPVVERSIRHLEEGVRADDFDVLHGLAGMARYLLFDPHHPQKRELLQEILTYMVRLCGEREWNGRVVPAWFIQPDRMVSPVEEHYFPKGHFNLGLSHGIPSVLALLALAMQQGHVVTGQRDALKTVSEWVWQARCVSEEGITWDSHLSYEHWEGQEIQKSAWNRDAWCYGTPGVAYALYLVGEALEDEDLKQRALQAYSSLFQRHENWGLYAPTLCHGYAGLLQITHRLYLKSGDERLARERESLVQRVLELYQEESRYGFRELRKETEKSDDFPGVLEGAAGAALVLLSLSQSREPEWDAAFLLS